MALKINGIYQHFKHGTRYLVTAVAHHTETGEALVIYHPIENTSKVYARPLEMFLGPVDKVKYPNVKQDDRFQFIDEERAYE